MAGPAAPSDCHRGSAWPARAAACLSLVARAPAAVQPCKLPTHCDAWARVLRARGDLSGNLKRVSATAGPCGRLRWWLSSREVADSLLYLVVRVPVGRDDGASARRLVMGIYSGLHF